jgi:adenine-specific DNA-methyltransferase
MKFMGSKRLMLQNGLGQLMRTEARKKKRIVDLFSGSASVSWFAAQEFAKPVISVDMQQFAAVLAKSVIERTEELNSTLLEAIWLNATIRRLAGTASWKHAQTLDARRPNAGTWSKSARRLCAQERGTGPMWRAYGGYYYSPSQAAIFDSLSRSLPDRGPARWVCSAALLIAASQCVASPGHTAQPFSSSRTAGPFLREAWLRNPINYIRIALRELATKYARVKGTAKVANASRVAAFLNASDLVFVDPPYSGVHYSRFYHVLETLARGGCGPVSGSGRYPPPNERPISRFSQKSQSKSAIDRLLRVLSVVGCKVIVTFPSDECSNGLSGGLVIQSAETYFRIEKMLVKTRFSTLGGNGQNRGARKDTKELMLVLRPR